LLKELCPYGTVCRRLLLILVVCQLLKGQSTMHGWTCTRNIDSTV